MTIENTEDTNEDISEEQVIQDEQAAFAAAFDGETQEEEYVVDEEALEEDQQEASDDGATEEDEKEETTVDWEAELKRERETSAKLESRLRNMEGRYGSMNAELKRISTESVRGYKHPDKEEIAESIKTVEGIDSLKEKYPEWAQDVEEREALRMSQIGINDYVSKDDVADLIRQNVGSVLTQDEFNAKLEKETEKLRVEFKHPGWVDTLQTKEFSDWFEKQDESVLALYKSTRSTDAIKLLDQFQQSQSKEIETEDRQKANASRLEKAIPATSSSRTRRPTKPTEHDAFLEGFGKR